MIYFIYAPSAGLVKIGYSKKPTSRFSGLLASCPVPLEYLGAVDGAGEMERKIHTLLFPHHQRNEWFRYNQEVATVIADLMSGSFDHSRLPAVATRSWALARRAVEKLDGMEATPTRARETGSAAA